MNISLVHEAFPTLVPFVVHFHNIGLVGVPPPQHLSYPLELVHIHPPLQRLLPSERYESIGVKRFKRHWLNRL